MARRSSGMNALSISKGDNVIVMNRLPECRIYLHKKTERGLLGVDRKDYCIRDVGRTYLDTLQRLLLSALWDVQQKLHRL